MRTSVFIKPATQIVDAPKKIPMFTPLVGISLEGEIKYPFLIDIKTLTIKAKYAKNFPNAPIATKAHREARLKELNAISRALFGTRFAKKPEQVVYLLDPKRLAEIDRNNKLILAAQEKRRWNEWSFDQPPINQ